MEDTDQDVSKLLIKNPMMSASTFLNLLRVKGMKIVDSLDDGAKSSPDAVKKPAKQKAESAPKKKVHWEAFSDWASQLKKKSDTSGSATSTTGILASKKESTKFSIQNKFIFSEKAQPDSDSLGPTRFKVQIIEEGLGNSQDNYYYSKQALKSCVPIFEGKKIYADHPSASEEQDRPERSVKDVVGHYENVQYTEADDGRGSVVADAVVLPDEPYRWARALMRHAVEYAQKFPDKSFIGISINAGGDANPVPIADLLKSDEVPQSAKPKLQEAAESGTETVKVVTQIQSAVSADLVTEAGAGGKVLKLSEAQADWSDDRKIKTWNTLTSGEEHKISACIDKMTGKVDTPGAYCNWLAQAAGYKPKENETQEEAMKKEDEAKHEAEEKKEDEGKMPPKAEKKAEADDSADADGADGDHADADQDKALIADMLKKYLGDDDSGDDDAHAMAKQAYEAYKEMGYGEDEALKCSGHAMKLAKHLMKKEAEAEEKKESSEDGDDSSDAKDSGDKPDLKKALGAKKKGGDDKSAPAKDDGDGDSDDSDDKQEDEGEEGKKESSKLIKLQGENAKLRETISKREAMDHIDKVLGDSKLSRSVTKKVREAASKVKTKEEFDRIFKIFMEGYKAQAAGEGGTGALVIQPEKSAFDSLPKLSFEDCVKN